MVFLLVIASFSFIITFLEKSESLDNESDESCSVHFRYFFFLLRLMIFHSLYFLSLDESDSLDDESDKLGSESGSSGT